MKDWLPFVGVVLVQCVLVLLFVLKLRADDRRRWHERRLDVYARFLRNVDLMIRKLATDLNGWDSAAQRDAAREVWERVMPEVDDESFEIELLASRKVSGAAYELTWVLAENIRFTQNDDPGEPTEPWYATEKVRDKRERFLEAVRAELGVGRGLWAGPWWRRVRR